LFGNDFSACHSGSCTRRDLAPLGLLEPIRSGYEQHDVGTKRGRKHTERSGAFRQLLARTHLAQYSVSKALAGPTITLKATLVA